MSCHVMGSSHLVGVISLPLLPPVAPVLDGPAALPALTDAILSDDDATSSSPPLWWEDAPSGPAAAAALALPTID